MRIQFSIAGAFGVVSAVAVACGLSWFVGVMPAFLCIGWFTALCFCRSSKSVLIVAGIPVFAWIAIGMFAIAGGFLKQVLAR